MIKKNITKFTIGLIVHEEPIETVALCLNSLNRSLSLANLTAELICVYTESESNEAQLKIMIMGWLKKPNKFSHVKWIPVSEAHNSIGLKRNLILQSAKSPYLYFTDPDVIHHADMFSILLSEWKAFENPDCFGLTGAYEQKSVSRWIQFQVRAVSFFSEIFGMAYQGAKSSKSRIDHAPCGHLLLDCKKAVAIGGFDEHFAKVGEDLDFSHRMSQHKGFYLFTKASTLHKLPGLCLSYRKFFQYGQAQTMVLEKNGFSIVRVYRVLPVLIFALLLGAALAGQNITLVSVFLIFSFSIVGVYSIGMIFALAQLFVQGLDRRRRWLSEVK